MITELLKANRIFNANRILGAALALGFVLAVLSGGAATPARALDTQAREAFLLDMTSGTVLFEKDADMPMPPASMSKIMTIYMVFERLREGRLSLDDMLPVSEKAWRMGGSKMFVEVNSQVRVEDLLRGVIIQSGNDACIVLAEALSGSEEAFAEEMNRKGREIGLTDSHFTNSTGWPDPNHRMTARDLATLAQRLIKDFPEYYHLYSELEFTYHGIRQGNRNPLLYKNIGADGLKTGHTEEAGYGLTASAERNGRRLIAVITGLPSVKARSEEAERLISWGFREFEAYALFQPGEEVERAAVWQGEEETVPLVFPEGLTVTLSRAARRDMTVKVKYDAPIPAPIVEGQQVATLEIEAGEGRLLTFPLQAGANVERLGIFGRAVASLKYMIFGVRTQ
ncbi:MAG: D-alanyl-D-alanine carboxypeptidase family protein [Kiloniellales bacterium]